MNGSLNLNFPRSHEPPGDHASDPAWQDPNPGSSKRDDATPSEPISADTGNGIEAALLLVAMLVAGIAVRVLVFFPLA